MSSAKTEHPTQEDLTDFALGIQNPQVAAHIAVCEQCAREVQEIDLVKKEVRGLPDEEVPEDLRNKIVSSNRHPHREKAVFILSDRKWMPIWVTLGLVLAGIFVYFLMICFN